jgi:hypothetical protein
MQFLADLKRKDGFYETYRQTVEELNKLREAHGILINMINNHHISVQDSDAILETEREEHLESEVIDSPQVNRVGIKTLLSCGVWSDPPQPNGDAPIRLPHRLIKRNVSSMVSELELGNERSFATQESAYVSRKQARSEYKQVVAGSGEKINFLQ